MAGTTGHGLLAAGAAHVKIFVAKGNTSFPSLCPQGAEKHQHICGEPHSAATGAMVDGVVRLVIAERVNIQCQARTDRAG